MAPHGLTGLSGASSAAGDGAASRHGLVGLIGPHEAEICLGREAANMRSDFEPRAHTITRCSAQTAADGARVNTTVCQTRCPRCKAPACVLHHYGSVGNVAGLPGRLG